MEETEIVDALSALAQPTRLALFRHLVAALPDKVAAGALTLRLDMPASTLSAHLSILAAAGLVSSQRQGRSILYRAEIDRLSAVIISLVNGCCGGRPELCHPIAAALDCCAEHESCLP